MSSHTADCSESVPVWAVSSATSPSRTPAARASSTASRVAMRLT